MIHTNSNNETRLKILLTEGSSTSARETLYALGPSHTIDILDPSPFCQGRFSRFVRRRFRCPTYSQDPVGYLRFLVERLRAEQYDVLFPTHEQVYLLSRAKRHLLNLTATTVPDFDALLRVYDKGSFTRLMQELGLPHPQTACAHSAADIEKLAELPVYVKLAHGTAGQTVWLVKTKEELAAVIEKLDRSGVFEQEQEILLQQPVIGEDEGMGGVFQNGRVVAVHGARTRVKGVGGAAMARTSLLRQSLVKDLQIIGEHLSWHGPLGFDYIYDPGSQKHYFLEACPRVGETVNQSISGDNWCEKMVQMALGKELETSLEFLPDVKTHQMFLNIVAKALKKEGRLELAREFWRYCRGKGMYQDSEDELTRPRDDWMSVIPAGAVTLLMLAYPNAAQWLVTRTVDNYSLTGDAAQRVRQISDQELDAIFEEDPRAS